MCQTIGAAIGPISTGRIYDLTDSYSYAFDLFVMACILGALVTLGCLSLESEQSRLMPVAITRGLAAHGSATSRAGPQDRHAAP